MRRRGQRWPSDKRRNQRRRELERRESALERARWRLDSSRRWMAAGAR